MVNHNLHGNVYGAKHRLTVSLWDLFASTSEGWRRCLSGDTLSLFTNAHFLSLWGFCFLCLQGCQSAAKGIHNPTTKWWTISPSDKGRRSSSGKWTHLSLSSSSSSFFSYLFISFLPLLLLNSGPKVELWATCRLQLKYSAVGIETETWLKCCLFYHVPAAEKRGGFQRISLWKTLNSEAILC